MTYKNFYKNLLDVMSSSNEICYVYGEDKRSYQDMYELVLKYNFVLNEYKQEKVIVLAEKSFENYCVLFAILLSENVWIPAEPKYPESRLIQMFELSKPKMVITDQKLSKTIKRFCDDHQIEIILMSEVKHSNKKKEINLGDFKGADLAYIMFTSGSTGVPKGVPMTHENYINFIHNALEILPFNKKEVFLDSHDLGFDISIFYLFCCVLTESAFSPVLTEMEKFCPVDNLIKNKVTVWATVPSSISRIKKLRPDDQIKTSIKIMFLCGEPFRLDILKYCYENMDLPHVYNFYGLTETGVENFYHECTHHDLERFKAQGFIPIGKPLTGNEIKISDNNELLISSKQITPGYLGGIGQERFLEIDGKSWFASGDVVKQFEDVYFCKGRLDSQVKLSGYRVELMDIENNIRRFPNISDSICFVELSSDKTLLIGVIESEKEISVKELKTFLKKELPSHMVPHQFYLKKEFPRNKSGKIDRTRMKKEFIRVD